MTQKENIAAAIVELESKISFLYDKMNTRDAMQIVFPIPLCDGLASTKEEFAEIAQSTHARRYISRKSIYDLTTEYENLRRYLRSQWEKYVDFKFADTDWYKEMKQDIFNAEENRISSYYKLSRQYFDKINEHLRSELGMDNIGINQMGHTSLSIGIVEKTIDKDDVIRNNFYFGHSFDLYMKDWYNKDEETTVLEMNYGTMGSFDPETDSSRVQLLNLICKYASNVELHKYMKRQMLRFSAEVEKIESDAKAVTKKFESKKAKFAELLPEHDQIFNNVFIVKER